MCCGVAFLYIVLYNYFIKDMKLISCFVSANYTATVRLLVVSIM